MSGKATDKRIVYRCAVFYNYIRPSMLILMPLWFPLFLWYLNAINNLYMIVAGAAFYLTGLWSVYWYLFRFPKSLSLTNRTLGLSYRWNTRSQQTWSLAHTTAVLKPQSLIIPCGKTLVLSNMNSGETVIVDIEAMIGGTWKVIHDLEDRGVQVTLLTKPRGRDPREDEDSEGGSTFLF